MADKTEALAVKPRQPLLPKYLKAVAPFFSRDETRPILGAVHLTPDEVVATDSYRLVKITYKGSSAADFPKIGDQPPMEGVMGPVNIDGKTFIKALSAVPAVRRSRFSTALPILRNVAVMAETDHTVTLGVTDLHQSTMFVASKTLGAFPNYEQLMPASNPHSFVCLNAKFLGDMAKAVQDFGATYCRLELRGPLKPVMFKAENEGATFEGLQMPVREDLDTDTDTRVTEAVQRLQDELNSTHYNSLEVKQAAIQDARDALDALLMGGAD